MNQDLVTQTELCRWTPNGGYTYRVIWLDQKLPNLSVVLLKGETEMWLVNRTFTTLPVDYVHYKGWNVGGLS